MADPVRVLTWNIQVYGPKKYGGNPNNYSVLRFCASVIADADPDVVMLMEIMSGNAEAIAFNLAECVEAYRAGETWGYLVQPARITGDRESYVFLFRTDGNRRVEPIVDGGKPVAGVASNLFPDKWASFSKNARRAAYMVFQTMPNKRRFVAAVYHSPPSNPEPGIYALSRMPETYHTAPASTAVASRFLAGDFNYAYDTANLSPWWGCFTNAAPGDGSVPPDDKKNTSAGSGTAAAVTAPAEVGTLLREFSNVGTEFGTDTTKWPVDSKKYRRSTFIIDNVFYPAGATAVTGTVLDPVAKITSVDATGAPNTRIAQTATQIAPMDDDGDVLFSNADQIPDTVSFVPSAYITYRYAVTDHLPVMVEAGL